MVTSHLIPILLRPRLVYKASPGPSSGQSVMTGGAGTTPRPPMTRLLLTLGLMLLLTLVTGGEAWPQLYRWIEYLVVVIM